MNKSKSVIIVNLISAAVIFFFGIGDSMAETPAAKDTSSLTISQKDGSIPGKRPGLTREELAKRSKEKGKIRRELIKKALTGNTILQK